MPKKTDTLAFEAAIQALLEPLVEYASSRGIGRRQLALILGDAVRGRRTSVAPSLSYDAAVRLIGRWTSDPTYSSRGKPRPLAETGPRSFASLARVARAGSPAVALASLKRSGLIQQDRTGTVRLKQGAYVPAVGDAERIDIFGRAAGQFLRVLTHNLSVSPEDRVLQRVASYDSIGSTSLTALRRALRREGLRALERANALLAARDRDRNPRAPGGRRSRVSFGVYMLAEPVAASAGSKSRKKR